MKIALKGMRVLLPKEDSYEAVMADIAIENDRILAVGTLPADFCRTGYWRGKTAW